MSDDNSSDESSGNAPALELGNRSGSSDITSADSGWGDEEATDERDESESVSGGEKSLDESEADATSESTSRPSLGEFRGSSPQPEGPIDSDSVPLPGTDYDGLPYVAKRTGKPATEWDRPANIKFQAFQETADILDDVAEWLDEEVYEGPNVLRADVQQAALLVGLANPEMIEDVLASWGYDTIDG